MDLKAGYWQVPLHESAQDKAAFITHRGLFRPKVLMFGLTNAPGTFQRMINTLFADLRSEGVIAYLDDLVIASASFEEHINTLRKVFQILLSAGLTVNVSKTKFCQRTVRVLGHIVTAAGVAVDSEKTSAIDNYPPPKNIKQLRTFLGLAGYYRRFVKNYSHASAPLTRLLQKDCEWNWGEDQIAAFNFLKNALVTSPILAPPDFQKPFFLHTDASNHGLGAVLSQKNGNTPIVIQYASRTLTNAEKRYSTTERELLAIVWSVDKFRPYIEGTHFTIFCDHSALTWLQNAKDPTGKFSRWLSRLQTFDFIIHHVSGKQNEVADALSRITEETGTSSPSCLAAGIPPASAEPPPGLSREDVISAQHNDARLGKVISFLQTGQPPGDDAAGKWASRVAPASLIQEDMLYRQVPGAVKDGDDGFRILAPRQLVPLILKLNHDIPTAGHLGYYKTLARIKQRFTWDGMTKTVLGYVRSCDTCQRHKTPQAKPSGLMKPATISEPFEVIGIDLKGPLPRTKKGTTHLLVVTDYMTKWVEIFPLRAATTKNIVSYLVDQVFTRFGLPKAIVSDNGKQFVSGIMKGVCSRLGITQRFTSYYCPQSNLTERVNRNIATMLAAYVTDNHQDYDDSLQQYAFALRTAVHEATGYTPAFLTFGRELRTASDVFPPIEGPIQGTAADYATVTANRIAEARSQAQRNIAKAQQNRKAYYDKTRSDVSYQAGQRVLVRAHPQSSAVKAFCAKLAPKYNGPYVIHQKLSDLTYRLRSEIPARLLKGTFHVSQLKPYVSREAVLDNPPDGQRYYLRPRAGTSSQH